MDSQTLMRNQSINAEQLHSEHQQEQEHSSNVLEQQQQFQQQVQPKEYYNLETEEHIQLTREEEEELAKCQGPVPEFHQLTARQERTMRKFHKSRYQEYVRRQAEYDRYNKRAANIRHHYIALARTKRPIEGDDEGAISSEMAVEDKVTAMNEQLTDNLKLRDNASVDIKSTDDTASEKAANTRMELYKIGQTLSWFASVTGNNSLVMYTGPKYTAINTFLRCKADLLRENPAYKENEPEFREALLSRLKKSFGGIGQNWLSETELMANNANSLLRKVALPRDLVLTRHIGMDGLKPFGLSFSNESSEADFANAVNAINGMGGQVYREDGACSTSYGSNRIGGNIELVILAHKGTNGVFAEPFSMNAGENEVILAPGQVFRILKAEKLEGKQAKVYVETIPNNDQGVAA